MKTLFYGGNIITMAEPLYCEAVLVEDGKIIAVGSEDEFRAVADEVVNLEGATMLPGFIDAHSHITTHAATWFHADVRGIGTFEELKEAVQNYIRENNIKNGEWVVVKEYDHTLFDGGKYLTLEQLDEITSEHLLVVRHNSGHAGLFNTLAIEHFGITPEMGEKNPEEILVENGKLTGCFKEGGFSTYNSKIPGVSVEEIIKVHPQIQKYYARNGITTAQEGYLSMRTIDIYRSVYENGEMLIDIIPYAPFRFYSQLLEKYKTLPSEGNWHFGGIKYFLDGSPQLRTAWVREPYLGGETCGLPIHSDEEVIDAFRFAAQKREQMLIHSNGDAAIAQFLRCLEVVTKEYPESKELRHVIIHGQLMGKDQLAKAAELGVIVSFFVAHCYYYADTHIRNLGKERGMNVSPTKSALENGIIFTFHQDAPVIEPNMLETVWCAVNRITREGVHLAGEEISVLDALRAVTVNAAYQYFEEDKKGSIEKGKLADFVILDKNPLEVPKETLRDIRVMQTYKCGKNIYSMEENNV